MGFRVVFTGSEKSLLPALRTRQPSDQHILKVRLVLETN